MTEDKSKNSGFDEIAADIEAGLEAGSDNKFWECAEHLLGEMHKNRRILQMADDMEAERFPNPMPPDRMPPDRMPPDRMPMDPVDRLKGRIHEVVHELSDLPADDRHDVLTSLLDDIESRMGASALEFLLRLIQPRLV